MARKKCGKWPEIPFSNHFGPIFSIFRAVLPPFSGPFSPHFSGKANIHFSAIFVPISGRRPEMGGPRDSKSRKCPKNVPTHFLDTPGHSWDSGKKRHININFLVWMLLGQPRECPRDNPGLSLGQPTFFPRTNPNFLYYFTQWKPPFSLGQAQFVPGTIPGTKGDTKGLCVKSLCAFFAR